MIFEGCNFKLPPVIAEIGLAHDGSMGFAMAWIDAAVKAGADIVKFQIHYGEDESTEEEKFRINFSKQDNSRKDYWDRTSFTDSQWREIKNYCESKNIEFTASPFSVRAINLLKSLNLKIIKIGSGDLLNAEFVENLLDYEGTLILSTGLASLNEIGNAVMAYELKVSKDQVIFMQCTSLYPTPLEESGAHMIKNLENYFKVPFGFSDHTSGLSASKVALVNGAKIVERHVNFDLEMFGPDTSSSITFTQLKELVKFRDDLNTIISQFDKDRIAMKLSSYKNLFGRSLCLNRDLPKGHILEKKDFTMKKPSGGDFTWEDRNALIGKRLVRDLSSKRHISSKDIGN